MKKLFITLGIISAATVLQWVLWDFVAPAPYLLFYPALTLCALWGDALGVAIIITIFIAQFLFVPPMYSLKLQWPQDILRGSFFAMSAVLIAGITRSLKMARIEAEKAAVELQQERDLRERFVATLTHDLRSPLTAAKTSAQMLSLHPDKGELRERLTYRIVDSIDRADRMVQDLLDVNRVRAGERLPLQIDHCDLRSILDDTIEELSIGHADRFVIRGPREKISGYWDAHALRRVIQNLANNAIKYGSPQGPITIEYGKSGQDVFVSVHNLLEGKPLSAEEIQGLWQPFKRAFSAQVSDKTGWGLGLPLVKGIVAAHGGSASVMSTQETGTTFKIVLPTDARNVTMPSGAAISSR